MTDVLRKYARSSPSVWALLVPLLLALAPTLASAQTGPVPVLELQFDSAEGTNRGFAVQRDATLDPTSKRAFTAGGRVRWQHRVDTMERMQSEEKIYEEVLRAIELSSDDNVLYTVSRRHLYREDISAGPPTATSPQDSWFLRTPDPEDEIMDVKVLPAPDHDKGIYVLTRQSLVALSFDPGGGGFTLEDIEARPAGLYNLMNFEVHRNVAGEWRAYVLGITNTPLSGATRGLAVCKLGDPTGAPAVHDVDFIAGREGGVWDPREDNAGNIAYSASCQNIALRNLGGTTRAYLACGFDRQITVLDVMDQGEDAGRWSHELDPLAPLGTVLDRIVLEQLDPTFDSVRGVHWSHDPNFFYALDRDKLWTVPVTPLPSFPKSSPASSFGVGEYEFIPIQIGSPGGVENHIWTLTRGPTPFVLKRFLATSSGATILSGQAYGMSTTDGAVAVPSPDNPEDAVIFVTTMGGVVKFTTTDTIEPQQFTVQPDSFQTSAPAGLNSHVTEQIAIGDLSHDPAQPQRHVFTTSGTGSFLAYELDDQLELSVPALYTPPLDLPCQSWNPQTQYIYSTSIEFSDRGEDGKWVIYDVINRTHGEIALVACRLDVEPAVWSCSEADDHNIIQPKLFTWHVDLTENWALISYEDGALQGGDPYGNGFSGGFLVFDLRDIGTPAFDAQTPLYVECAPLDKIGGASMNADETLILASGAHLEDGHLPGMRLSGGVLVFEFDASTTPPTVTRVAERLEEPDPSLEGSAADGFTWSNMNYFDTGYRCRWFENEGVDTWALVQYVGGTLYQFSYAEERAVALDLDGVWHGRDQLDGEVWQGYHHEGQDARLYDFGFGTRILYGQNAESFAIVRPAGLQEQTSGPHIK